MQEAHEKWKRKRRDTVEVLKKLAKETNEAQTQHNKLKFGGSAASAGATIVTMAGAVVLTGGLATPIVVGLAGLGLGGSVVSAFAGYSISSHSASKKQEVESVIKKEKLSWMILCTKIEKLAKYLEDFVCTINASEDENPFCNVPVEGIPMMNTKTARLIIPTLAALRRLYDYMDLTQMVAELQRAAKTTVTGARQLVQLSMDTTDIAKLEALIASVEEALSASKRMVPTETLLTFVTKIADTTTDLADNCVLIGTKLGGETAETAVKLVKSGAEKATTASKAVAQKMWKTAPILLNVVCVAMDAYDMYSSYESARGGQSEMGKKIIMKANELEQQQEEMEILVNKLITDLRQL